MGDSVKSIKLIDAYVEGLYLRQVYEFIDGENAGRRFTIFVPNIRLCQRCGVELHEGPTSLDDERYTRGVCGGCD